jgi:hypothetical protein
MQDQSTSQNPAGNPAGQATDDAHGSPISQPPAVSGQGFDASAYFKSYIEQAKLIVMQPHVFFANMPISGGYKEPATFYATGLLIYALLQSAVQLNPFLFFVSAMALPAASLAASGIAYGLAKSMGGKPESFEAVVRVYAYSGVILAGSWVPVLGAVLSLYAFVLQYFGLKEVCKLDTVKTVALCVIAGILSMVAAVLIGIAIAIKQALHI